MKIERRRVADQLAVLDSRSKLCGLYCDALLHGLLFLRKEAGCSAEQNNKDNEAFHKNPLQIMMDSCFPPVKM